MKKNQGDRPRVRHLRHLCRKNGVPYADAAAALNNSTISGAVKEIIARLAKRGATCTRRQARMRFDAALTPLKHFYSQRAYGRRRRLIAATAAPRTIGQRKVSQATRLAKVTDFGRWFSGSTDRDVQCQCVGRGEAEAWTTTTDGDRYSGTRYFKTNAVHHIRLSLSDVIAARRTPVPAVVDGCAVLAAKQVRDGVYAVQILATVRKRVDVFRRFIADQGDGMFYVAKTERGAVTALNRSRRVSAAEKSGKISGDLITSWGWCSAGVRQWCRDHGIRRDIRRRIRRGVSREAIARLIARHGGARDSYDLRLIG